MRAAPIALLLALAAAAPGAAQAAGITFTPCTPTGYECGRLTVPLDRTGSLPGSVSLFVKRVRAAADPDRVAVVPLAGGPGQAATPLAPDFAEALAPALAGRDLLVLDQRGTGGSSPLSCPALRAGDGLLAALACAGELGARRGLYRSADSVSDLEALREATGYEKLVLYGVSYGTRVAEAYAAAYPQHVQSLVLDSVVPPSGPDAFRRSSFAAIRPMLADLCGSSCRAFTSSPGRDLANLARRLRRRALHGTVVDGHGRRLRASIGDSGLFEVLLAGDLNPALRSELPGAVHGALRGDATPLLRLFARAQGLGIGDQAADEDVNTVVFRATTCEETKLPWPREETSPRRRAEAAVKAARAIPPRAVAPFGREAALDGGVAPVCLGWPAAFPPTPPPGPLPPVPTLVLEGAGDLRTPVADARRTIAGVPGAQLLVVPRTGHSVLGSDLTSCSRDAVGAFFAGGPVARCAAAAPTFAPVPPPPMSLDRVRPAAGIGGRAGRTFAALRLTVRDLRLESIGIGLAQGAPPARIGGLRGGHAVRQGKGLRLSAVSYVPGVEVSGTIPDHGTAVLRVGGRAAARGTVRVTEGGRATGTLGGRRVAVSIAARALRAAAGLRLPGPLARVP